MTDAGAGSQPIFLGFFCTNTFFSFLVSRKVPSAHKVRKFSTLFTILTWLSSLDLVSDLANISLLSFQTANQKQHSPPEFWILH